MKTTSRNLQLFGGAFFNDTPVVSRGILLYDADCALCAGSIFHSRILLDHYRIRRLPIRTPWVFELLVKRGLDPFSEMRLLKDDGALLGGADVFVELARTIWWAKPLHWLAQIPGVLPLLRRGYVALARRRHCLNGVCKLRHAHL